MEKRALEALYERCRATATPDLWEPLLAVEPAKPVPGPIQVGLAALGQADARYVLATDLTLQGESASAALSRDSATYIRTTMEGPNIPHCHVSLVLRDSVLQGIRFEDEDNIANSLFVDTRVHVADGSRCWFDYGCWFHDCEVSRPPPRGTHCLFTTGQQDPDAPMAPEQASGLMRRHVGSPLWSAAVRWGLRSGITVSGTVRAGVQELVDELLHASSGPQTRGARPTLPQRSVLGLPNGSLVYSHYPTTGIILREGAQTRVWFGVPHLMLAFDLAGCPPGLRRLSLWPE